MGIKKYFLFFLFFAASASAQKNLVVYHTTGEVKIISGNKTSIAERGNAITKNDALLVKKNSDCMLISAGGKSMQVSVAGTYNFDALQKMISKSADDNVSSKFFSYVYENLFSGHKTDKLGVTPVVFRGEKLMKMPGDYAIIISDDFTLQWKKSSGNSTVDLIIKDSAQSLLDTIVKKISFLQINLSQRNLLPGKAYRWKAQEHGLHQKEEQYFSFLIAEKRDRKKIINDLKLLQNKMLNVETKLQLQQDIFIKWKEYYSLGK